MKGKQAQVKNISRSKKPQDIPKSASPAIRQMIEKAQAKAEKKAQQAQTKSNENLEAQSLDETIEAAKSAGRNAKGTARTLKKSVKVAQKGVRTVSRLKEQHKETSESKNELLQQRDQGKMKLQKRKVEIRNKKPDSKTQSSPIKQKTTAPARSEKPPKQAASLHRFKTKKARAKKAKAHEFQRTIKSKDGTVKKIACTALTTAAAKNKLIRHRIGKKAVQKGAAFSKDQLKNQAKQAMQYNGGSQSYENKELDQAIARGSEGAGLAQKGIVKAGQTAKNKLLERKQKQVDAATTPNPTTPQNTAASSHKKHDQGKASSPHTKEKHIVPKQKPTMQNAKTRSSLAKSSNSIKEKSQVFAAKQNTQPLKTRVVKRHQIKKARLAQQQVQQKAAQIAKATAKQAVVIMKRVAEATAATVKSLIAAIGGTGFFIVLLLLIFVVGFLAASPFGLFMSNDTKNGRPLAEVIAELDAELGASTGGMESEDEGETVAGNWIDVIAVFAVRTTTTKDIALDVGVLDEKRVDLLREVLHDMNQVTTRQVTQTITKDDGTTETVTKTVSSVKSKTAQEMADYYHFDADQRALLDELLSDEYFDWLMELLGEAGLMSRQISNEELASIIRDLPVIDGSIQSQVIQLALTKLGTDYDQDLRNVEGHFDCSSFTYWVFKQFGINLAYEGADTAGYQAKWIDANGLAVTYDDLQPGDLVFWSYGTNDRYKNINHVAIVRPGRTK